MKSSPRIWHYVVSVKSAVKISSIFVAFLENMNFNWGSPNEFGGLQSRFLSQYILDLVTILKALALAE